MKREDVEIDKRRAMTPARKRRIWTAWDGKCWFCKMPVDMEGPGVVYDHVNPLFIKGSDADEDIGPIHAATCDKIKTAADQTKIAKIKRIWKKSDPETRKPPTMQSRSFQTNLSKGFNGKVRPR